MTTLTLSMAAVTGAAVFVAWRYTGLKTWQAVVCVLFGFYLASTGLAPEVSHVVASLLSLLPGH